MNFKRPGFLPVFLLILLMGLGVRFADFSSAVAEEKKPKTEEVKAAGATDKKEPAKEGEIAKTETKVTETDAPPEDELNDAQITVLKQLSERRRTLDAREKQIEQREALLKAANDELAKKYGELDAVRTEIKKLLDIQSEEEEARLASLVKVYEGMKPQQAAAILNTMDTTVLMQVMGRMSERKLSPVMAAMNPDKAREVTINLAIQKKLPEGAADIAPPVLPEPTAPPKTP